MAIAVLLWLVGTYIKLPLNTTANPPKPYRRFTIISAVVTINYSVLFIGIPMNSFGGWIDSLGADICEITFVIGGCLIPVSIVYTFIYRYGTKHKQWDILGPSLSILFYMIVWFVSEIF